MLSPRRLLKFCYYSLLKLLIPKGYLRESGWLQSGLRNQSTDAAGQPLPWLTYPMIELLSERVKKHWRVFEYGSGSSSLWWASRVEKVVSVEHDRSWYEHTRQHMPANTTLYHEELAAKGSGAENPNYFRCIEKQNELFEVIVVDGRERVNCLKTAVPHLSQDGVIILDNSDRGRYQEGIDFLLSKGFSRLRLSGLAPGLLDRNESSLFYRQENCMGI